MQKYELTIILSSDFDKEAQDKVIAAVKKIIQDGKAKLDNLTELGEREFAFFIKKQKKGFYYLFNFSCETQDILEIQRKIKLEEKITRYLVVRVEEKRQGGTDQPVKRKDVSKITK